ncbi:MAG TPA: hypothetical protein VMN60_10730 [Longimicrobiales bacterium]|nr:hypothetical protein [Longimicrobiales bacterium]
MMKVSACPNCDGKRLYRSRKSVSAGGGYAPDVLPGLGKWGFAAKVIPVVCQDCGMIRLFASPEARAKLASSKKWERALA